MKDKANFNDELYQIGIETKRSIATRKADLIGKNKSKYDLSLAKISQKDIAQQRSTNVTPDRNMNKTLRDQVSNLPKIYIDQESDKSLMNTQ